MDRISALGTLRATRAAHARLVTLVSVSLAFAGGCACSEPPGSEECDTGECSAHATGTCTGDVLVCDCHTGYSGALCDACAPGYALESDLCVPEEEPPCDLPFSCGESEPRPAVVYAPPRFRAVVVPTPAGALSHASAGYGVNDRGQLAGTAQTRPAGGGYRWYAFRFSESGGLEDVGGTEAITTTGLAINDDGVVTGSASWVGGPDRAFVSDGESFEDIGITLGDGMTSLGVAINDAGQVVGECDVAGTYRICRHTPGAGWELFEDGGAYGVADDGTMVGLAFSLDTQGFVRRDGEALVAIGPRSPFGSLPRAISGNGRYVVAFQARPTATSPEGSALWIDLESGEPAIAIGDVDGRPTRDLHAQPWGVNDDGFAVGMGHDERAGDAAWIFDPRRGEVMRLDALTELPGEGWTIEDARAISDTGYIAATGAHPTTGESAAMLLVPLDWPEVDRPDDEREDEAITYEALPVPDGVDDAPGSIALGITSAGDVLVASPFWISEHGTAALRGAWWRDGTLSFFDDPAGEWSLGRTSRGGVAVGSVAVRDELSDVQTFHPFARRGDGALAPIALPDGAAHTFGYDVDDAGAVLAECVGDEGPYACVLDAGGTWSAPFLGQPSAMSENGVVVGARADDAVVSEGGATTTLGLGAGAIASAISDDGRFVAGMYGHAFVYDREREIFDWLPDAAGDPATAGSVLPRAVSDEGVVVGRASDVDGHPFAFLYDPRDGELVRLDTRIGVSALVLRDARDIDARGAIVANGVEPDGTERGVVLVPR